MNARTSKGHQIIERDGIPLFVVVPYEDYLDLSGEEDEIAAEEATIPLEVSQIANLEDKSLIQAWREYKGLTQEDVAARMGVTRAGFAQMEAKGANPRRATLKKIAAALAVEVEQLMD